MKTIIRRILGLTLTLMLLCLAAIPAAGAEVTATAAEEAVEKLTPILGTPKKLASQQIENNEMDVVNSRTVIIGYKEKVGSDLVVIIRVSASTAMYWELDLTEENYDKAVATLEESSPANVLGYYVNGEVADMAISYTGGTGEMSYEGMLKGAQRIRQTIFGSSGGSTASGTKAGSKEGSGSGSGNPLEGLLLEPFPGIAWGQSRKDFENMFGANIFVNNQTLENNENSSFMSAMKTVNGDSVLYIFSFEYEQFESIMILVDGSRIDYYLNAYTERFGTPFRTDFVSTLVGEPEEKADGDCYAWKVGSTLVYISTSGLGLGYRLIK